MFKNIFKRRKRTEADEILALNEYWVRLVTLITYAGTNILREIFHTRGAFDYDPIRLNVQLKQYQTKLRRLSTGKKAVLKQNQLDILFPPGKNETYSEQFDITLLVVLIQHCTSIKAPSTGWSYEKLKPNETCLASYIIKLRTIRNEIFHKPNIEYQEFLIYWDRIIYILNILGYDITKVEMLQSGSLDDLDFAKVTIIETKLLHLQRSIENLSSDIKENEESCNNLHLEVGTLSEDVQTIEDTVNTISKNIADLQNTDQTFLTEIDTLKKGLQDACHATDMINFTLSKAQFNYQISLKRTSDALNKMTCGMNELEKRIIDIEEKIEQDKDFPQETFVERLENTSEMLKTSFTAKYENECLQNPFSMDNLNNEEKIYVDLVISNAVHTSEDDSLNDREHFIQAHLNRTGRIALDEIIDFNNEKLVLLRGAAGVGKSVLTKHLTYLWAKGQLWQHIKLLFFFTCKEINMLTSVKNLHQLLREKYPEVFYYINFKELHRISKEICIIVDGLDEFLGITEFKTIYSGTRHIIALPITKCMYSIFSHNDNNIVSSSVVVAGRPSACSTLLDCIRIKTRKIDILGFSTENVERYIEEFSNGNEELKNNIQEAIRSNVNIELMTRIPVYLSIICSLFKSQEEFPLPQTITELYVLQLLVFMKHHLRDKNIELMHYKLVEIAQCEAVCKIIVDLASVAYTMLGKVVLESKDIETLSNLENLKSVGMIRQLSSNALETKYQFFHLSMQEFLAAIYATLNGLNLDDVYYKFSKRRRMVTREISDKKFRAMLPSMFGLQGAEISDHENPTLSQVLITNLRRCYPDAKSSPLSINKFYQRVVEKAEKSIYDKNLEYELFFHCYHEYQHKMDRNTWLKTKHDGGLNIIFNPRLPVHLKHFITFLRNESRYILTVSIESLRDEVFTTSQESKTDFIKLLLQIKRLKLHEEVLEILPLTDIQFSTPSNENEEININLRTLVIDLSKQNTIFDHTWLKLPTRLVLNCSNSLDVLKETLNEWRRDNDFENLDVLTVESWRNSFGHENKVSHVFALLHIFSVIPKIIIKLNTWELDGFNSCSQMAEDLSKFFSPNRGKLEILELNLTDKKHTYLIEDGVTRCSRCFAGDNRRTPKVYQDEIHSWSFGSNDSNSSVHYSINSDDGDHTILISDDTTSQVKCYQTKLFKFCMGGITLCVIIGVLGFALWWFLH